nr:heterodisulfide reductase-related iron-sulfur binding cluster [Seinonella peptonophila]
MMTGCVLWLFFDVVYRRYRWIRLGRPHLFDWRIKDRIHEVAIHVFGQKRLLQDRRSGFMHVVMFYGFIIIQFGAIDLVLKGLFPGQHLPLPAYHVFLGIQEVTVTLVLFATIYAGYRRYVERLPRLKRGFRSGIVVILLTSLMSTILGAAVFEKIIFSLPLGFATPISSFFALLFRSSISPSFAWFAFYVCWWLHLFVLFAFLLYIPQSKHFHLLTAPINVFLKRLRFPGKLAPVNFEDEEQESFGVAKIEDFNQKQLLDLYACVECGRCTEVCPASGTGKMLSPMDLIVNLRDHLTVKGAAMTSRSPWVPGFTFLGKDKPTQVLPLHEGVVTAQELWACTTCRNCEEVCPVMNEHVDKIVDLRRYLVMDQGEMAPEAARTMQQIERQGNPWGLSKKDRIRWVEHAEVPVPTVKEAPDFEYLFYVGSMGSYDRRSQKISQSLVRILKKANVSFAILGNEEKNSGDTVRRLGNEFLFQELAQVNIETFSEYDVKKIVTIDPHALQVIKNEYPDFGYKVEVLHHTQLIAQLLRQGRLKPVHPVYKRVTYHDSCYLGRYNGEYDAPRFILKQIPGLTLVEIERNRERAMCCGAGGGLMWLEEKEGKRVNIARTEQALAVSPDLIGSACPYCLTMLSDGVKAKEKEAQVDTLDVIEILAQSLE